VGLYSTKRRFVAALVGLEDRLVAAGVRADTLTHAALPMGIATGLALVAGAHLQPACWLAVAPLSLGRMALNALDGAVARRTGTTHTRGAVLNELVDRAADVSTVAAGYLLPIHPALVTAALLGTLLVPFVAVVTQAATGTRLHDGPMGKPDRVLVLSLGAAAAAVVGATALTWTYLALTVGAAATVVVRVRGCLALADVADLGEVPPTPQELGAPRVTIDA